jgi:hypothetical protein
VLGISDRTFSRLEAEGVLVPTTPGVGRRPSEWDLTVTVPAYLAHREEKITGNLENPRDRAFLAQAALSEFKLQQARGEVLPRADWIRKGQQLAAAFSGWARQVPERLARAGCLVPERDAEALAAVDEMLRDITRWTERDLEAVELLPAARGPHGDDH